MLNGSQVLGSIDGVMNEAMGETNALTREIGALADRLVTLREEETAAYRRLAQLRLSDLAGDGLVKDLSAAEKQARILLDQRSDAVAAVDNRLADVVTELARLGAQRAAMVDELNGKTAALDTAETSALHALAETDEYKAAVAAAEEADKVARHAEQKTAFAEQDRTGKGKPYEDDPLFMYLWNRGWGTPGYEGGGLTRFFDGKVARLIDYDKARANYFMLQEIPKRLAVHAEQQRANADTAAKQVEAMEHAAVATGEAAERRHEVEEVQERLEALDDQVEAAQQQRTAIVAERTSLTSGDDERTQQALDGVVAALQRQDLQELRHQAERTPLPEDDTLVDRIQDIEQDIAETKQALGSRKAMQAEQQKRLAELERVRHDARRQGYGRDSFNFGSADVLSTLLAQVLAGGMSRDVLWDQMNRRRMPRMPGGFGGGLGGGLGGGMPRFPGGFGGGRRRGGFGGGGGGGRGGGGFRTGGGF